MASSSDFSSLYPSIFDSSYLIPYDSLYPSNFLSEIYGPHTTHVIYQHYNPNFTRMNKLICINKNTVEDIKSASLCFEQNNNDTELDFEEIQQSVLGLSEWQLDAFLYLIYTPEHNVLLRRLSWLRKLFICNKWIENQQDYYHSCSKCENPDRYYPEHGEPSFDYPSYVDAFFETLQIT
jgi:hypothetical protein